VGVDVLILNTAVVDLRRPEFAFADKLAGQGGLAKCRMEDMPDYSQEQIETWIEEGPVTAGGPGNTAPLIALAGLQVAVGVNLGAGRYGGLDAQGRYFYDVMVSHGIDMSATHIHPTLPTGTTFIHSSPGAERGGIAYFPNANDDFDLDIFREAVERLRPRIVYYMYSGLSNRADAHGGRDLAEFIRWCRYRGAMTIADSHTLTANPHRLIAAGQAVGEYRLLEPLLPELDVFFTSSDEAKLIENTLVGPRDWGRADEHENNTHFLDFLTERSWYNDGRTRLFGVTVHDGAYAKCLHPDGRTDGPAKVASDVLAGRIVDLVGAGDSFRAGLLAYMAYTLDDFKRGTIDFRQAVQTGNRFASLFITAPLHDRYGPIRKYVRTLRRLGAKGQALKRNGAEKMAKKSTQVTWQDKVSHHSQVGGIETSTLDNGPGKGTRIAWINTGSGLRYKVAIDRALDIVDAFYNQHSLVWLSHAGVTTPRPDANHGIEWLWSFAGGLVTTCGLSHAGAPDDDESGQRGLHGRISNIPAEVESVIQPDLRSGRLQMSISAVTREARVFGPTLELRRTISSTLGEAVIHIRDVVTNLGNAPTPHMMLYHCNYGWPLVDDGTQIIWKGTCRSRGMDMDNAIFNDKHDYRTCRKPSEAHRAGGEACGFIDVTPDKNGMCTIGLYNAKLGLVVMTKYKKKQLPCMANWQHWGPGEYVCGLEPATNFPIGQSAARRQKKLIYLAPGKSRTYDLEISVLTKDKEIKQFLKAAGQ
jgi:sugar/nucleoside kinase (ribokinase family)